MKNAVIVHVYSDKNKGDQGIVFSTIELLKEKGYKISLLSQYSAYDTRYQYDHEHFRKESYFPYPALFPEPDIRRHRTLKKGNKLKKAFLFFYFLLKNQLYLIFFKANRNLPKVIMNKHERKAWEMLLNTELVVVKGGSFFYCFNDINNIFFYFRILYVLYFSKKMGKRVVIFPQSMGPWETQISRWLSRAILKKIDVIMVREKKSFEYMKRQNIQNDHIYTLVDVAMFFKEAEKVKDFNLILAKYNVGISARPYWFRNKEREEMYVKSLVSAICYLQKKWKYKIFLFPQSIGPTEDENDLNMLDKIFYSLPEREEVIYLKGNFNAKEMVYMYSKMDFLIATRLHAAIFAMSQNVPAIAISYHGTKTTGLYEMMGLSDLQLEIEDISPKKIHNKIDYLINNLADFKQRIDKSKTAFEKDLKKKMDFIF